MAITTGHSARNHLGAILDAVIDTDAVKVTIRDEGGAIVRSQYELVASGADVVHVMALSTGQFILSYLDGADEVLHRLRSLESEPGVNDWETVI